MSSLLATVFDGFNTVAQATTPSSPASSSKDSSLSQILLYVGGFAGIASAIVAILKLKPDANSQSVTQAQGAATEWTRLYDRSERELSQAERERDWWRDRCLEAESLLRQANIVVPPWPPLGPPPGPPSG